MGITVRVDSPGVGANLDDHVEGLVFWEAAKPMVTESTQWWEIGLFTTVDEGVTQPDLMMHYGSVPFDMNTLRHGYPTTDNGFCLTPNVTQGRSRGTVRLRSRDFRDRPGSTRATSPIPRATTSGSCSPGCGWPARSPSSPRWPRGWAASWRPAPTRPPTTSCSTTSTSATTPSTTRRRPRGWGRSSDPMAVLDPQLRVKGVTGLRVVDASAMPKLPSVNPNITVMTMAEKCAELIRGN